MSVPMKKDDPAYWMLETGRLEEWAVATGQISEDEATWRSKSTVYNSRCYICNDPEFSLMGLPLCYPCPECGAHTPADNVVCDNGHEWDYLDDGQSNE